MDIVIDRMKHWAHRLYPKLPFDDVTKQIAHVGKKMQVQANVKKMRLGMDLDPHFEKDVADEDDEENQDPTKKQQQNQEDDVERYLIYLLRTSKIKKKISSLHSTLNILF